MIKRFLMKFRDDGIYDFPRFIDNKFKMGSMIVDNVVDDMGLPIPITIPHRASARISMYNLKMIIVGNLKFTIPMKDGTTKTVIDEENVMKVEIDLRLHHKFWLSVSGDFTEDEIHELHHMEGWIIKEA